MTIRHHPREDTLMAYAAGTLVSALSALVSCHLGYCPKCRADVRHVEMIGGALLGRIEDADLGGKVFERMIARPPVLMHTAAVARPADEPPSDGVLPKPLARHFGMRIDGMPWRTLAPGIEQYKVPMARGGGDMRLLRVQPGLKLLRHGHYGAELTLVLKGAYTDETGDYHAGEVADLDEDIEHRPRVLGDDECICIIAGETYPRYKTLTLRLLRPFFGY
jgi:putative transcriptional regulator